MRVVKCAIVLLSRIKGVGTEGPASWRFHSTRCRPSRACTVRDTRVMAESGDAEVVWFQEEVGLMRSVRSGPKKYSQRRSQAAWKLLLGVMLPSVCVGAFQVASAAAPELHAACA